MLPTVLARQLQQGLADYITTTFPMTNHLFQGSLDKLLATKDAVFQEPYLAVRLPFRVAADMPDLFLSIHIPFKPYLHQQRAFERLTGEDGRSTLIATGTGSGKTECFLYPILEYCYRHRGESGIKALIIYPMNALASDQAKRIAELIHDSPELRGNVTAGMYVGGHEQHPSLIMSATQIITDHETMLSSPPDILLTNYKMLDYLLVRPKDAALWQQNRPETLKYIAVDELHTFDGAQGTDLACLLRRLKARLYTPHGYLCCIGTSATMGAKDSAAGIRDYASTVFGEQLEDDAVITEDRLSPSEFFDGHDSSDFTIPANNDITAMQALIEAGDQAAYLAAAAQGWFDDTFVVADIMAEQARVLLGERLLVHSFTQSLLLHLGGNYVQPSHVCHALSPLYPQLAQLHNAPAAVDGLIALISHARIRAGSKLRPFLTVQVQVWMRELRRLLAKVSPTAVTYALSSDLNDLQAKQYLPIVNCRDCGETGWVSLINERHNVTMTDLNTFYNLYFKCDKKVVMLFPHSDNDAVPRYLYQARICSKCLQFHHGDGTGSECSACGTETTVVVFPLNNTIGKGDKKQYFCPFCGSRHGLSLMGLRSATAISATVSQMFASPFNDDKKTLAFSDNVQDAAHRAGFFNSRTWKFGLRSAIQRFALAEGHGLSLAAFSSRFIAYWRRQLTDEEFVSLFIAPNMTWVRAYETMRSRGKLEASQEVHRLLAWIENRLQYEIMLEYGLTSRIGRTLEKAGCSVIEFDADLIAKVAATVKDRAINELGALHQTPEIVFERMVAGVLYIMRANGAFNDAVFSTFTNNDGNSYLLSNDREKWMPGMQPGRNVPRFVHEPSGTTKRLPGFDLISHPQYTGWIEECLEEVLVRDDVCDGLSKIIFAELIASRLLVPMSAPATYKVWALDKDKIAISTAVTQLECEVCGHQISVASANHHFWEAAPCVRSHCGGRLTRSTVATLGYYGRLYSGGDLVRVTAKEHTGLLKRDDREELERVFKRGGAGRKPWDANLLSCTPTLEMGIDIGDLSTVVLCSIPPAQAQFLQRAGRAGRTDGNALTIAVANARPHDLYFYADPMEMIAGAVEPPQIFLRASAVLERQFVAYCLDCWIKRGVPAKAIPKRVGVCLAKLDERPIDLFPFNFLLFVQNNLSGLIRTFMQMFTPGLDDSTSNELRSFAQGNKLADSPMHMKVYEAFASLKQQKSALASNIKQLQQLIKELKARPQDSSYEQEIKELKSERAALVNVVRSLSNKDVFNFLSDEGLLPNYAFPEAGIVLKAVLYRKDDSQPDQQTGTAAPKRKYEKMVFEYNRSASSAISEFAPSNHFYVDGRKLTINQIDLTTAQAAKWRLCPNCSHAQMETGQHAACCPQCGSPAWADSGQVRTMLKVQMVYSNMDYTRSLIGDESDDRNSTFYCKQMLVDVNEDTDIITAYRMDNDEFPFGYEFVKKATLREINFGEKDIVGEKLLVSGVEDIRKGFKICKYCGKIQPERGAPEHAYTCKAKNSTAATADTYAECLFLYREFVTEALRLLIPATTMDVAKVRQESFIAAFMLGMKKYFGNVDHLRACLSEVPVADADYRKQYLVIYDSVPGGTGYLKQLMQRSEALVEIFEKAITVLENCTCKTDPQKDGCYHCLYAYRQSQNIGQISRSTALRLLKFIVSGKSNVEEIAKLANIPVNSLFESELERRFVEALEQMGSDTRKLTITKQLVNTKEGYLLKVGDCLWEIEPQVLLDNHYGVTVPSRADFVLWPVRASAGQKPVAIFTDGFLYHKDRVADDTLKREAIRRSGQFRIWVLSWKDVQHVFRDQGDYATATLLLDRSPTAAKMYKGVIGTGDSRLHPDKTSTFALLLNYLENKDAEQLFALHGQAYAMSLFDGKNINNSIAFAEWSYIIEPVSEALALRDRRFALTDTMFGTWIPRSANAHLTIVAGVASTDLKKHNTKAVVTVCAVLADESDKLTDKYEAEWNGFWHFFNLMQFAPSFAAVSVTGMKQLVYHAIPVTGEETGGAMEPGAGDGWDEIMEQLFDDDAKDYAAKLRTAGIPAPTIVGYELTASSGAVIGECELAWEQEQVAVLLVSQLDSKDKFLAQGWKVFTTEDEFAGEWVHGGNER